MRPTCAPAYGRTASPPPFTGQRSERDAPRLRTGTDAWSWLVRQAATRRTDMLDDQHIPDDTGRIRFMVGVVSFAWVAVIAAAVTSLA